MTHAIVHELLVWIQPGIDKITKRGKYNQQAQGWGFAASGGELDDHCRYEGENPHQYIAPEQPADSRPCACSGKQADMPGFHGQGLAVLAPG